MGDLEPMPKRTTCVHPDSEGKGTFLFPMVRNPCPNTQNGYSEIRLNSMNFELIVLCLKNQYFIGSWVHKFMGSCVHGCVVSWVHDIMGLWDCSHLDMVHGVGLALA